MMGLLISRKRVSRFCSRMQQLSRWTGLRGKRVTVRGGQEESRGEEERDRGYVWHFKEKYWANDIRVKLDDTVDT